MTITELSIPTVEIDTIRQHPANPRRNAVADDSMVESIRVQGLLEPLMVAPDPDAPDRWILIDGHRRLDGSHKAGLTQVPVNPRYDLVSETQQIYVMAVTGLQKDLLTPVEEAAAYEQLTLQGMDVRAIAAETGFSAKRVTGRLRLNALTEQARDQLYLGEATLEDAESLLEFADDPDETAHLTELFGSHNFRYEVQAARSRRDRRIRNQAIVDAYVDLGATETTYQSGQHLPRFHKEKLRSPDAHKGCLGWVGDIDSYSEPYLVCTKPTKHKDTVTDQEPEPEISDWEARREERAAEQAAAEAATAARLHFLRGHLNALFPTKGNGKLADLAKAMVPLLIFDGREAVEERTLLAALDIAPDKDALAGAYYAQVQAAKGAFAAGMSIASPAKAIGALADYLAAMIADHLGTEPAWVDTSDEVQYLLLLWDWLAAAGYVLSDADKAALARVEARLAELDSGDD